MRGRKREYRYRSGGAGVTHLSLERLGHLAKVGRILYIRGLQYRPKASAMPNTVVIVRGDKGYARFEGFCWGYGGEGPHGLRRLFDALRIPQSIAAHVAHDIKSPDGRTPGEVWRITCGEDFETFSLKVYEDGLTQYNKYVLGCEEQPIQKQLAFDDGPVCYCGSCDGRIVESK